LIVESQQRPLSIIIFSHQRALLEQVCTRIEVIA
ncbi:ABC transporter ATP-binding protein, partial [Obesumbacterium proteus]|nr:ABC transporter ATP-binding protein [Obesumbacterium proteus]